MYRASKALSVVQACDYYRKEYTRGDYYEHDTRERKGEWYGKGAERLGLRGQVERDDFHALLEGRSPEGRVLVVGEAATEKHRAGWDFTCSADKSVSLVALVGETRACGKHTGWPSIAAWPSLNATSRPRTAPASVRPRWKWWRRGSSTRAAASSTLNCTPTSS